MSWAKLDDQYPDHPKIVKVGPLGMALHTAATCYCARYLTDGFVPAEMINRLISFDGISTTCNGVTSQVVTTDVANELVKVGLFDEVDGGYLVHDYGKYNPPAKQVKEKREETKRRVSEWREKNRGKNGKFGGNAVTNDVTNSVRTSLVTSAPSPSPSLINTTTGGARPNIFAIYEREIGALTPIIADELIDAEATYPEDWIIAALQESARQNKRNWKYTLAILKRWKVDGFQSVNKGIPNGRAHSPKTKAQQIADSNKDVLRRALEKAEARNGE